MLLVGTGRRRVTFARRAAVSAANCPDFPRR
jgi:hypothetical protein